MTMLAQQRRPTVARRAVLDLGSSSFHLLVADVAAGDAPVPVADLKCTVRLGEHALATGAISADAWRRGLDAVDQLAAQARALSAPLTIVGTSVLRETRNGRSFAVEVTHRTGCEVSILSGEDEARLAWIGARATRPSGGRMAVLDLGGGSLEIAVGDDHGFLMMRSLPLGFLRVRTAEAVREGAAAAAVSVRALCPSAVVLTGGTARVLARLAGARGLRLDAVSALATQLAALDDAGRIALGVPATRADTIAAGATIVATIMELLGVEYAQVAESGLREGVLAS